MWQYLAEASLSMAVFYLLYQWLLRAHTEFRFNRLYLLVALVASLAVPLLRWPVVAVGGVAETLPTITLSTVTVAVGQEVSRFPSIAAWLLAVWLVGALIGLLLLLKDMAALWLAVRKYPNIPQKGYRMVLTGGTLPVSSFFRYLFWDETSGMSQQDALQIQRHELAHIRQGHTWDLLLANVVKAVFWFHPVAHWWVSALEEQHEYLADEAVLKQADPESYARLVTLTLFRQLQLNLSHSFNSSITKRRINMMFKEKSSSFPIFRVGTLFASVLVAVFFFACEVEQPAEVATTKTMEIEPADQLPEGSGEVIEDVVQKQPGVGRTLQEDGNEVFEVVEHTAAPVGGFEQFYGDLAQELKYPESAKNAKMEGKVYVQFVVDKDGTITDVKAIKSPDDALSAEAVRVVQAMPKWLPGKQSDKPVKQRIVLPIMFKLS